MNFTQQYGKNRQSVNIINFTMLYGNYCYIIIENFPQKFVPCTYYIKYLRALRSKRLVVGRSFDRSSPDGPHGYLLVVASVKITVTDP